MQITAERSTGRNPGATRTWVRRRSTDALSFGVGGFPRKRAWLMKALTRGYRTISHRRPGVSNIGHSPPDSTLVGFHLNAVAQGQVGEDLLNLVEQMVEARRLDLHIEPQGDVKACAAAKFRNEPVAHPVPDFGRD